MPRRKKLKRGDIKKNTSIEISHTINKIKENELKYTIILVLVFMLSFIVIGYFSLRVTNKYVELKDSSLNKVTLTNDNIMSDQMGLNSEEYIYHLDNKSNKPITYEIVLVSDDKLTNIDNCYIKYAMNDNVIYTLNKNMVVTELELDSYKNIDIRVRFWLDDDSSFSGNCYFKGHLEAK